MSAQDFAADTLVDLVERYLEALQRQGRAVSTRAVRAWALRRWALLLTDRGRTRPADLGVADADEFLASERRRLLPHGPRRGLPLSRATIQVALSAMRGFSRWLVRQDLVLLDPCRDLPRERPPLPLPRTLTVKAVKQLLAVGSGADPVSRRDRAIVELAYSSGLRVGELVALDLVDLDLGAGEVAVRRGKGDRSRRAPLGPPAVRALSIYLKRARARLARRDHPTTALFLSQAGTRIRRRRVERIVRKKARQAGLPGRVTPHMLRHSAALHLLQGGADVRHVQEFLGHAEATTTQRYTPLSIQDLHEVHRRCHPRAKMRKEER